MDKTEILSRLNIPKFYQELIPSLKINGKSETLGLCPFHDDHRPSLSVNVETGLYHCFSCDASGDVFAFYQRYNDCDFPTAIRELGALVGGTTADTKPKIVATFKYLDEVGDVLYLKERLEPGRNGRSKEFVFKHLVNGKSTFGRGCDPVLYNLSQVVKSKHVFVVEGESKADLLNSWGLTATCLDSGANSPMKNEYIQTFGSKEKIVILPDNDQPGIGYASRIANALHGKVEDLKIVELPGLSEAEDVLDWSKIPGNTKEKLVELVKNTPEWNPAGAVKADGLFGLTHAKDLLNEAEEATDWLMEGLLPSGGFSIITSKPKVGKSTLVKQMALNIARGLPFFGRTVMQGAVIYLALEDKRAEIRKHLKAMGMTSDDPFYLYAGGAPMDAIKRIASDIAAIKPVLLVIDTLFRLIRLKDGNSYSEVTNALNPLILLARESGVSILGVHHARKGDSEIEDCLLGSTAIFGSVDTTILLKRYEGYRTIQSMQRYGDDMPETVLVFDKSVGLTSIGGAKEEQDIRMMENAILEFLSKQAEPVDEKTIHGGTTGGRLPKQKALRELLESGKIIRTGEGKRGNPFLYSGTLVQSGTPEKTETPYQLFDQKNDPKKDSGTLVRRYILVPEKRNDKSGCEPHGCKKDSGTLVHAYEGYEKNSHVPAFLNEKPMLNFGENPAEEIAEIGNITPVDVVKKKEISEEIIECEFAEEIKNHV